MSLLSVIRGAFAKRSGTGENCFRCVHFCTSPARVEAELPGLATLSSAHASVRAQDGLCLVHQRVINGQNRCIAFAMECTLGLASKTPFL